MIKILFSSLRHLQASEEDGQGPAALVRRRRLLGLQLPERAVPVRLPRAVQRVRGRGGGNDFDDGSGSCFGFILIRLGQQGPMVPSLMHLLYTSSVQKYRS